MTTEPLRYPTFIPIQTCSFSGATLLCFLLGLHPEIATVGEINGIIKSEDPDKYQCSCGELIKECSFWKSVQAVMEQKGFRFNMADFKTDFNFGKSRVIRRFRTCSFRSNFLDGLRDLILDSFKIEYEETKERIARNEALVECILEVMGRKTIIDSSKDRLKVKYLRQYSRLEMRHIFLVRDVRGFVASFMRHFPGCDAREAARIWVKENSKLERFFQTIPEARLMRIKYEDLCQDTDNMLNKIFLFCGVKPILNKNFRTDKQHIVGNMMRLSKECRIKHDERWRSVLNSRQLEVIERVAGKLKAKYGYQ